MANVGFDRLIGLVVPLNASPPDSRCGRGVAAGRWSTAEVLGLGGLAGGHGMGCVGREEESGEGMAVGREKRERTRSVVTCGHRVVQTTECLDRY